MDAQQLHDLIITPALDHMDLLGGNYNTKEARFLLLGTDAIESNCGHKIAQSNMAYGKGGLGMFQMESKTHDDIWLNCDALKNGEFVSLISRLRDRRRVRNEWEHLVTSPMYACAMSRLKYAMDEEALPKLTSDRAFIEVAFYKQYKRIYNTELGASTFNKWIEALRTNGIFNVNLGE